MNGFVKPRSPPWTVPSFRGESQVPSGRSYLLDLGESELLLLSFTLAAVRLRCLFSPVFLLSWCTQVSNPAVLGVPLRLGVQAQNLWVHTRVPWN